jgi:hypothetical protein
VTAILTLEELRKQALDAAAHYTTKTVEETEPGETRALVFDSTTRGFIMGVRWAEKYYKLRNLGSGDNGGY